MSTTTGSLSSIGFLAASLNVSVAQLRTIAGAGGRLCLWSTLTACPIFHQAGEEAIRRLAGRREPETRSAHRK